MTKTPPALYGMMAEFTRPDELLAAAKQAKSAGYTKMDAYAPYPVEGLPGVLGLSSSLLPLIFLLGGLAGGAGGYAMQWYAMAYAYPLNVGGRPLHSWPAFIPVTFELTILVAALLGVLGLFLILRMPRMNHPVFAVPGFERASEDRFFLCVECRDPRFSLENVRAFLEALHPLRVVEVYGAGTDIGEGTK